MFYNFMFLNTDYYLYSSIYSFSNAVNNTIAINNALYALNKNKNITKLYVYKDLIGQLSGLGLAYIMKNDDKDNTKKLLQNGYKVCALQTIANMFEFSLIYYPSKYLIFSGISNTLKNVTWITLGGINAQLIANIAKKNDDEISNIYTNISIINTLSGSLGMYLGTKISSYPKLKHIFPYMAILQFYTINKMIKST